MAKRNDRKKPERQMVNRVIASLISSGRNARAQAAAINSIYQKPVSYR